MFFDTDGTLHYKNTKVTELTVTVTNSNVLILKPSWCPPRLQNHMICLKTCLTYNLLPDTMTITGGEEGLNVPRPVTLPFIKGLSSQSFLKQICLLCKLDYSLPFIVSMKILKCPT